MAGAREPSGTHDHAHDHAHAGRVPFWVHQLVELLLGGLLLIEGARTGEHTVVLVSLGGVLLLLALCSDGALGAWTWIGRRLHRVLDLVAAAVLALSPLALGLDHALPIVILEAAAVAMIWLAFRTEWRPRPKRARRSTATAAPRPEPAPAAAPPAAAPPAAAPPAAAPPTAAAAPTRSAPAVPPAPPVASAPGPVPTAAPLARKLGSAAGKARDDGPRQLGRLVGRAQRAAKAAMSQPEPSAPAAPEPSEPPRVPPEPPATDPPA